MKKILYLNSFSGVLQIILNMTLVFFTIPYFIYKLGTELYGVFSLILLIGNLNIFANLGLNSSLIKFLAEQGKSKESDYDIAIVFIIQISIFLPITILCLILNNFILTDIFNIYSKIINDDLRLFFNFMVIANFLVVIGQIFTAILDSQQQVFFTNLYQFIYNLLYWSLIILALYFSNKLSYIGLSILLSTVIWFVLISVTTYYVWGKINYKGLIENFIRCFKKQIKYSVKIYLAGSFNFFYEPFTKILIAQFIGMSEVGYFDIAIRVRTQVWNLSYKLLYPVYPFISQLKDIAKIKLYVNDIEQKLAFIVVPFMVMIIFITEPLVSLWLNNPNPLISFSIIIMVCGYLLCTIVLPNYQYLTAKDHAGKTVLLQATNVIVNGIVFMIFYKMIGYYAAIIGHFAAITGSVSLGLYYQKKYLGNFIFDSTNQFLKIISIFLILLLTGFILKQIIGSNLTQILIIPLIIVLFSIILYRYFNIISLTDIDRYLGKNNLANKVFSIIFLRNI